MASSPHTVPGFASLIQPSVGAALRSKWRQEWDTVLAEKEAEFLKRREELSHPVAVCAVARVLSPFWLFSSRVCELLSHALSRKIDRYTGGAA